MDILFSILGGIVIGVVVASALVLVYAANMIKHWW